MSDKLNYKSAKDIPRLTITDIKEAPMQGFIVAEENETGAYITKRGKDVGVMMSVEHYEALIDELNEYRK